MSRLARDGTAESVSRDQILRRERDQGNIPFPCSADHEEDWRPCLVDLYSVICDDHTLTYIHYLKVLVEVVSSMIFRQSYIIWSFEKIPPRESVLNSSNSNY